ncbi:pyridoxal phosphate-dependent aminotransferase [Halorubellus sp. PRR65]|uniref:pyridoxal phosphate-dependent aminotransferase n=1 Tax=Halorubellus sp. PRR65 TaxID=3098148 RepID=UPI002B2609DF|nr:pyridoxal phosphate-dependent aminotransferase [Halorubellus sp. PRR65]
MFPAIEYLSWIDGRPDEVAYDLASSDLRPATQADGPIPDRLTDRADPPGDPRLDALVADQYGVSPDEVLVTAGATNANALAFAVAAQRLARDPERTTATSDIGPDDDASTSRILVEKPGYEPLTATPKGFGARVDRFMRPQGVLDPARVDGALTDATDLVAVTDRHNPTGRRADRDALAATADLVADADARLLVDEVYAPFTTSPTDDPFGAPSMAGTDGVVATGSLTKFLGFGGLRIGWLVADPQFVAAAERVRHHLPSVASPSVALARRTFHHLDDLAADRRRRIQRNHDLLADFAADHHDLAGHVHDGATYALLEHDAVDGDTLTDRALDADVLVVPGRFFDRPDAVRVSLGRPTQQGSAALDALADVLDDLP